MTSPLTLVLEVSRLGIETTAKGLLAKLAHDLSITASDFSAQASFEADTATVVLRVPVRGLSVEGVRRRGVVDRTVLSSSDRTDIARKLREEVLTSAEVVITASATVAEGARRAAATGTIEVGRKTAPLRFDADVKRNGADATVSGRATVSLAALSIPPVKGPLNAFRVDDAIDVTFELSFAPAVP
jgi:hypothetical protein